jgi:hypothetical protein
MKKNNLAEHLAMRTLTSAGVLATKGDPHVDQAYNKKL